MNAPPTKHTAPAAHDNYGGARPAPPILVTAPRRGTAVPAGQLRRTTHADAAAAVSSTPPSRKPLDTRSAQAGQCPPGHTSVHTAENTAPVMSTPSAVASSTRIQPFTLPRYRSAG